jgi:hypothetical protein
MKTMSRCVVGLGLALAGLSGCQTHVPAVGMTLPSGRYLEHPPQYIPQSPAFPLSRELARQEEIAAQAMARERGFTLTPPGPAPAPVVPSTGPAGSPVQAAPAPAPAPAPGM